MVGLFDARKEIKQLAALSQHKLPNQAAVKGK